MDIDFVIPWVDDGDPCWQKQRCLYSGAEAGEACRYRDWELLPYWFRAVEAYAPWVHGIYFVTWKQIPDWLNPQHPKLHLIDHRDFIPEAYFPTFSSHVIELNFHRIPELSEHFVYFNDDMFLNGPVEPEDFFRNELPCDCAILDNFCPMTIGEAYTHAQCNVMGFLNKHFVKREVLRMHPGKWFSHVYGKSLLKNIYGAATRHFSNFRNLHIPSSMLKSTYVQVWELEPKLLHETCTHKFRELSDVNQYIMSYYNLCSGRFAPRRPSFGKCYSIGLTDSEMLADIQRGTHKVICLNDHAAVADFETEKALLLRVYMEKLPDKCSFER